jgi:hypothetical protein
MLASAMKMNRMSQPSTSTHTLSGFEEMFSRLIDPRVRDGSMRLLADFTEETATAYRKHLYSFEGVDVVLLEGIFCSNGSSSSDTTSVSGSIVASRPRWSGPSLTRGTRALRYDCCLRTMNAFTFRPNAYISSPMPPRDGADLVYAN